MAEVDDTVADHDSPEQRYKLSNPNSWAGC
jgi:hypothetical protein